mmetsp:Transcript_49269/g.130866  ORF Transcript_49269/g.130866 Transcript_49269/m.130866 type:complete len:218 (-) Transcript_49269:1154-1807(-)
MQGWLIPAFHCDLLDSVVYCGCRPQPSLRAQGGADEARRPAQPLPGSAAPSPRLQGRVQPRGGPEGGPHRRQAQVGARRRAAHVQQHLAHLVHVALHRHRDEGGDAEAQDQAPEPEEEGQPGHEPAVPHLHERAAGHVGERRHHAVEHAEAAPQGDEDWLRHDVGPELGDHDGDHEHPSHHRRREEPMPRPRGEVRRPDQWQGGRPTHKVRRQLDRR